MATIGVLCLADSVNRAGGTQEAQAGEILQRQGVFVLKVVLSREGSLFGLTVLCETSSTRCGGGPRAASTSGRKQTGRQASGGGQACFTATCVCH